jgi:hypothetical protein
MDIFILQNYLIIKPDLFKKIWHSVWLIITGNKKSDMKSSTIITAIGSSTLYNEKMLVDFVTRNLLSVEPLQDDSVPVNFLTIVWSSATMPVKGILEIVSEDKEYGNIKRVNIPVDSLFFITCTKDETGICRVSWSNSLS